MRIFLILATTLFLVAGCKRETRVARGIQEQTLYHGIGVDLGSLDPHLATEIGQYTVLSALLEGLVAEDPVDLHPVPGVAERWDVSEDGLTYTFHLRAGARWSNGEAVTAQHFVDSFQRVLDPRLAAENAARLFILRNAEGFHRGVIKTFDQVGASALDARTLQLRLEYASSGFLSQLNHVAFLPVYLPSVAAKGEPHSRQTQWALPGNFIGNGPFALDAWRNGQEIVVRKSDSYWDAAKVRLARIHFVFTPDREAEEKAFRAGQLHITETVPTSRIEAWRRDRPEQLRTDAYLGTEFYRINTSKPVLDDARFRRALSLAIDRKIIVEQITRGGQTPAERFLPPRLGVPGPVKPISYRPDEARSLLAAAGYPEGKGAPTVEILFNTSESHRAVAETIQQMWRKELNLQVKLVNQERTVTLAARRSGDYQILRSVWIGDDLDPLSFLQILAPNNPNNFTQWSNQDLEPLLFRAARTRDDTARLDLLREAEGMILEGMPIIPIYHYTHVFLLHPAVKNWNPTLLDRHPYKHVYLEP